MGHGKNVRALDFQSYHSPHVRVCKIVMATFQNCCLTCLGRSDKLHIVQRITSMMAAGYWYNKGGFRGANRHVDHRCTVPKKPAA